MGDAPFVWKAGDAFDCFVKLYPDGSFGCAGREQSFVDAAEEARIDDNGENDHAHFTKIGRVRVTIAEVRDRCEPPPATAADLLRRAVQTKGIDPKLKAQIEAVLQQQDPRP